MAKIFTKLNLADIVATSGGKSFRKLSTEDDSIIGTWLFNNTLTMSPIWRLSEIASNAYGAMKHSSYNGSNIDAMSITSTGWSIHTKQGLSAWPYSSGKWQSGWEKQLEIYDTSIIETYADYEKFVTWLKANATKVG